MNHLTIIIPVYQSEKIIPDLINRLNDFFEDERSPAFEVIFIDDSSSDRSVDLLQQQSKKFEFRIIQLLKNQGQHTATAVGIGLANTPLIATIDDDLQHDPFELISLIDEQKRCDADLVYGKYIQKEHSLWRNIGSRLIKRIFQIMGNDYNDVTSFRLMKGEFAKRFESLQSKIVFLDFELQQLSRVRTSCEVRHFERENGDSTYSIKSLLIFAIKILLYHSGYPLRLISRMGLFIAFICFVIGLYFIYSKIFYNAPIGFTSIIVSIFFSTGIILFSLGIIGEYIRKLWVNSSSLKTIQFRDINETF